MAKQRVGVLMGGASAEREISIKSGIAVADALSRGGFDVVRIDTGTGGDLGRRLVQARIDVAFLALHGRHGEDGCAQGVLEMLGIPYTGSGVLASALAMDKLKSKELFRLHNVPTPPYYILSEPLAQKLDECHGSFGFPVVVKPRREGSSVGVSVARDLRQLAVAVQRAFEHDDSVLVERFIRGREIGVGILDGRVLGAIEIEPANGIYDYEAKYQSRTTQYFLPARLPECRIRGVLNLAERAASALGCTGAVRVDLIATDGQNEYVLEVNTLPGMTETSLMPKIAAAAGFDFAELCSSILAGARCHVGGGRVKSVTTAEAPSVSDAAAEPLRVAV
jgi:D-alanine-D-alanine ligase